jgi:membrane-bound ClpP family serine protease
VREPIAPGAPGWLFVNGEIWRAVSDRPLAAGTRAQVVAVNGLEVTVRPPDPLAVPPWVASKIR